MYQYFLGIVLISNSNDSLSLFLLLALFGLFVVRLPSGIFALPFFPLSFLSIRFSSPSHLDVPFLLMGLVPRLGW